MDKELHKPDKIESNWVDDLDALTVFNLLRTHACLSPIMEGNFRHLSLTSAQFNTLLVLRRAGPEGMKMSELGEHLNVTKANMTGLVDRLERQGWIIREHLEDRRVSWISLSVEGGQKMEEVCEDLPQRLARLTACLSEEEKNALVALLRKLRASWRHLRREGEAL